MSDGFPTKDINNLFEYLKEVKNISDSWQKNDIVHVPWFRGQTKSSDKPIPSVFRPDCQYNEFWMNMSFRNKAQTFDNNTPDISRLDSWLFLMQHLGLPTRLLDWTESSLIALYFALKNAFKHEDCNPAVWIIQPFALNKESVGVETLPPTWDENKITFRYFQMAFYQFHQDESKQKFINAVHKVISKDLQIDKNGVEKLLTLPIAVQTSYVHLRMQAQKSVFTIHGFDKRNFEDIYCGTNLVKDGFFRKLIIKGDLKEMLKELKNHGVDESVIYPDLEGLARELKFKYNKMLNRVID